MARIGKAIRCLKIPSHFGLFQSLQLEEMLLRTSNKNWCILSRGSQISSEIIMGISGKPEALLNIPRCVQDSIPVIRRFTGGGTVVADRDTVFVSFICNHSLLPPQFQKSPRKVMKWSADFYSAVFQKFASTKDESQLFKLREHDYCIGERKVAGNAQCITKDRWVHHTSFLWDYAPQNMKYLKIPKKQPAYRENRNHDDFLLPIRNICDSDRTIEEPTHEIFIESVLSILEESFDVEMIADGIAHPDVARCIKAIQDGTSTHRKSTRYIDLGFQ